MFLGIGIVPVLTLLASSEYLPDDPPVPGIGMDILASLLVLLLVVGLFLLLLAVLAVLEVVVEVGVSDDGGGTPLNEKG